MEWLGVIWIVVLNSSWITLSKLGDSAAFESPVGSSICTLGNNRLSTDLLKNYTHPFQRLKTLYSMEKNQYK